MNSHINDKFGDIKGETESTTLADQAINTKYLKNKILKGENDSKYWLSKQHEETIDHLTSGCPILVTYEAS
jgi:hypothetical protein